MAPRVPAAHVWGKGPTGMLEGSQQWGSLRVTHRLGSQVCAEFPRDSAVALLGRGLPAQGSPDARQGPKLRPLLPPPAGTHPQPQVPQPQRPGEGRHAAVPECSDLQPGGLPGEEAPGGGRHPLPALATFTAWPQPACPLRPLHFFFLTPNKWIFYQ